MNDFNHDNVKDWMLWVLYIIVFLIFAKNAFGEPIYGQDFLGSANPNFNVGAAGVYVAKGDALGNLDNTFNSSTASVSYLLSSVHPKYYRIHIINCTCIRNGNCGPYEIGYGYSKESFDKAVRNKDPRIIRPFRNRVALYKGLMAAGHDDTRPIISPGLEHDLSKEAWRVLADNALDVWPGVQLSNSADGGISVERYRGAWIERHGTSGLSGADIISTDGAEVTDADIEALKRKCKTAKICFAWSRGYNCRTNSTTFVDPRKRTACTDKGNLEGISRIFDERGPIKPLEGSVSCVRREFAEPNIWKPLAEDTGNGDLRANKPVLIINFKASFVNLIDFKGHTVGRLDYYGPYGKTQWRYYSAYRQGSGFVGYRFEKEARSSSGSPYTYIKGAGKCFGPIVAGRRNGLYH